MLLAKPPMSYVLAILFFLGCYLVPACMYFGLDCLLSHRLYTFRYVWENQAHIMLEPSPLSSFEKRWRKSKLANSEYLLSFFVSIHTDVYTSHGYIH